MAMIPVGLTRKYVRWRDPVAIAFESLRKLKHNIKIKFKKHFIWLENG
jgi:hypothetical protein